MDGVDQNGSGNGLMTPSRPFTIVPLVTGFLVIALLSAFVFARFGDLARFLETAKEARPWWMLAAVVFQVLTYAATGEMWNVSVRASGRRLRTRTLARFAVEKLSIDQFMPSAGIAGHVGVLQAMRRFGLPASVAMESFFIDVLSYHAAYACAALGAFAFLSFHREVTSVVLVILGAFSLLTISVLATTIRLLRNRGRHLPTWISERSIVSRLLRAMSQISSRRVLSPRVLSKAFVLQFSVFVLDGATFYSTLRAIGVAVPYGIAFAAYVIAMIAGTVSFIPGGIGTFEVATVTILFGFGVSLEGALAGTLLLRGLTLWIPLIPGSILAHHDLVPKGDRTERTD
ncbi:MAG TPA: lysylphosphatidylglycerol synthase transmembrane domain-containing protein [Candidatus Fimivivens sp.]|nr:lysylphosphatidylglycerol synthase transmembrane domain-containing protein [Candidatus Fimivivens sp.]